MSANAAPTFYVGGNIGGNYNVVGDKDVVMKDLYYGNEMSIAKLELPKITYKMGLDAGVIFGNKSNVYRYGASVFYDNRCKIYILG